MSNKKKEQSSNPGQELNTFIEVFMRVPIIKEIPKKGISEVRSWKPGYYVEQNDIDGYQLQVEALIFALTYIYGDEATSDEHSSFFRHYRNEWESLHNQVINKFPNKRIRPYVTFNPADNDYGHDLQPWIEYETKS